MWLNTLWNVISQILILPKINITYYYNELNNLSYLYIYIYLFKMYDIEKILRFIVQIFLSILIELKYLIHLLCTINNIISVESKFSIDIMNEPID